MMRSLFSAVSGLQNHQTRMDVIGNNVSNVNTTGFKKGRATFQDILSQTLTGAAKPTDERGGLNPKQVGLGMSIASIDTIHSQGSLQTTGKNTDLAITGEGFFALKDGEQTFYTRSGNFLIDKYGTLVNPNGLRVQGWKAQDMDDGTRFVNPSAPLEDLEIPLGEKLEARETSIVLFKSNLDSDTQILPPNATDSEILQNTHFTSIDVVDRYGTKRKMMTQFQRTGVNQWRANVTIDGIATENMSVNIGEVKIDTDNVFLMQFNTDGTISSITENAGQNVQTDGDGNLVASVTYQLPDGTTQTYNMNLGTAGQVSESITQFASPTSTKSWDQDGYTMGYLESFKIDDSGTITGVYDNGERRDIGQIALSTFMNPGGLEKSGESLYVQSNNSGNANIGEAGTQSRGKIYAGTLEMSNVDLAETFTDMIITERGFQANSRVITTSDEMLREILGLKR